MIGYTADAASPKGRRLAGLYNQVQSTRSDQVQLLPSARNMSSHNAQNRGTAKIAHSEKGLRHSSTGAIEAFSL